MDSEILNKNGQPEWWKMVLKREIARLEKTSVAGSKKLDEPRNALWLQQIGDSIIASAQLIRNGVTTVTLTNIHTHENETITLNPKLTALENAALYHKKAKKTEKMEVEKSNKVNEMQRNLLQMQNALNLINSLPSPADPELILQAVSAAISALQPVLSGINTSCLSNVNAVDRPPPYRHFVIGGWDLYMGKTDEQNDELSIRFAAPSDIWFHVAGHAGSHVIIRRPKGTPSPPKKVVDAAASLAAWFSKARNAPAVEVHMTEARSVHKHRGAPAGEVTLEQWKSIRIRPQSPEQLFTDSATQ